MYNRYIPQSDGTYRRSRQPEQQEPPRQPQPQEMPHPESCPPSQEMPPCQNCVHHSPPRPPAPRPKPSGPPMGIGSFFRQLLPREFDTEDLMVVLLLLLMAGDCREEQNSALMTLVLYLFL